MRWSWSVADARELAWVRRELLARATAAQPAPTCGTGAPVMAGAVERLLLVVSELTTNGLRHANPPVEVVVTRAGDAWLVVASDGHVAAGPVLHALDPRRAGQHGLIVVAAVSTASGWFTDSGSKHVWATVPDVPPPGLLHRLAPPV